MPRQRSVSDSSLSSCSCDNEYYAHSREYPPHSSRKEVIAEYMEAPQWVKRKLKEKGRKIKLSFQTKKARAEQNKQRIGAHS